MALPRTVDSILSFANQLLPEADRQYLLDALNMVHEEICLTAAATKTTLTIPVGGGTREYSLQSDVAWVRHCTYYQAASSRGDVMTGVSVEDKDKVEPQWRQVVPGVPRQFYVDAGNIGLHPPPAVTNVADYPQVRLEVVTINTLASGDSIPAAFPSVLAHRYGTVALAAAQLAPTDERVKELLSVYSGLYARAQQTLKLVMARRNRPHIPQVYPANFGRRAT